MICAQDIGVVLNFSCRAGDPVEVGIGEKWETAWVTALLPKFKNEMSTKVVDVSYRVQTKSGRVVEGIDRTRKKSKTTRLTHELFISFSLSLRAHPSCQITPHPYPPGYALSPASQGLEGQPPPK